LIRAFTPSWPQTTNGDGFGIGWYNDAGSPVLCGALINLERPESRELSGHIRSRLVFAHVRASTGTPVQHTNCHPFRHAKWRMHNGLLNRFDEIKRDLVLGIDPALYSAIKGSSD
jgi:glutamine amidotransferase